MGTCVCSRVSFGNAVSSSSPRARVRVGRRLGPPLMTAESTPPIPSCPRFSGECGSCKVGGLAPSGGVPPE